MTSTPISHNSTVEAAILKIEHEARAVLAQHPEGMTNAEVSFALGLTKNDPKQWHSYCVLQTLIKKGVVTKPEGGKQYFSVSRVSPAPIPVRPFGQAAS